VVGTVGPDGTFQIQTVAPGDHSVELRRDRMRSRVLRRNFAAGQTVRLADSDVAVRAVNGTLRFNVQPASAQVTVARAGGGAPQSATGSAMELEEGTYTVTARAPGYVDRSETVQLTAGQATPVNITLSRDQHRPATPPPGPMDGFGAGTWTTEGQWSIHRGAGTLLYKPTGYGIYAFNIMLASGGSIIRSKNVSWVVSYKDEKNYIMYKLERNDFRRIQVIGGRRSETARRSHLIEMGDYLMASVQVEVLAGGINVKVRRGGGWAAMDSWTAPDPVVTQGRFGIVVEGKDEVRVSGFSFTPRE